MVSLKKLITTVEVMIIERRLATKLKHIKEVGNLSITTNHPHRSKSAPATTPRNSSHAVWQQHRLNIVSKPLSPVSQHSRPPDEFDPFDRESVNGEEWYSGGKSEEQGRRMDSHPVILEERVQSVTLQETDIKTDSLLHRLF